MTARQWKRLDAAKRVEEQKLTVAQGAALLGLSVRQFQRILRAVEKRGAKGVLHGNAGRCPSHRIDEQTRAKVVQLMRVKYVGFNDQHFTEKLAEKEGIELSRSTVRRILRGEGMGPARRRRPRRHRRRRDRKAQAGMMILWDGSRHDWLEGRGPMMCLMAAIDDATGELLPGAHFLEQESAAGYLRVLLAITKEKGLPWSAYMDQHGTLKRNDQKWTLQEELQGEQEPTQVGAALKSLDIEVIYALSPQAKGRVERLWGTLQDRLTSELRLVKAATLEAANRVLERYRSDHNGRFTVEAAEADPAWRPVRQGVDLQRVCAFRYDAAVANDNTIRIGGRVIDVPPGPNKRSYAKARVEVRQLLDGSWRVYKQNQVIATAPSTEVSEVRALKKRRSKASEAFRAMVLQTR